MFKLRLHQSSGRGDRIRTCDHLVPNQVRYRTALRPDVDMPLFGCKGKNFFRLFSTRSDIFCRRQSFGRLFEDIRLIIVNFVVGFL